MIIENPVSPVIFSIGPFELRWYSLAILVAVLWMIFWIWRNMRKGDKLPEDTIFSIAIIGIVSGVVFARLLHVIDNIVVAKVHPELAISGVVNDYTQDWGAIIGGEGLTAWGAVLGAALGIWIFCKIKKIKIGYFFDMLAPAVIMAQAIGRVGCLFNGCCYGVSTDLPWGMKYTNSNLAACAAGVTHPTVIYEIIFNVLAFVLLYKLRNKLKPAGSLFVLYLCLYSAWRLGIDFLRDGAPFFFDLHQAQFIGLVILVVGVPWMVKNTRWTGNGNGDDIDYIDNREIPVENITDSKENQEETTKPE